MQFITLDQRIAVENFEVGIIYTVTFSNGDSFTGACIGIGPDFVAFQRTAPKLLFCLTMTTAADVASIEHLPEEIGQILEYTGSVPVSIKTDGSPLLNYLITGKTVQSGTPTPDNPIMPEGCGVLEAGQYKIPISSNSTTTPVYLGEVETTRKIKKLVLDGTEDWKIYTNPGWNVVRFRTLATGATANTGLCTHYPYILQSGGTTDHFYTNVFGDLYIFSTSISSTDDFKTYLQQQYANGTPVCVWYILATEETAVVNEPLMRIGDYADTLSYRQSGVNIPTTDGLNIFDINTTVKPSEVYLKYFSPLF